MCDDDMNSIVRLLLVALLLLFVVAPFAGLAPLLLVMLFAGILWLVNDWVATLRGTEHTEEGDRPGT